jgi:hypothetical protein
MNWSDPTTLTNLGLAVATFALVVVTLIYTRATRKMADVMRADYVARNSPVLDVIHEFLHNPRGEMFTCAATFTLVNRGLVPIRVEEAIVRLGDNIMSEQRELILGIGERHPIQLRLRAADFAVEVFERRPAELVVEVRYVDLEGRTLTKRVPLHPWGQRGTQDATPNP